MDKETIAIIIQGGSVSIALYLAYILQKLIGNHMQHSTDAILKLSKTIVKLNTLISKQTKVLKKNGS